ncbi:hypothetical protein ACQP00_41515 [Dactylosporangium sp. CS-047395]|uniref:hypothetical protein n=1 Tax=Dactylosporangium sp. CS-047395 TaxID=3239936 RepID=UPI003D8D998B
MDSMVLNLLALAMSMLALGVSGVLARRQITMMRHGNEVPVLIDLLQELRSPEFQKAEEYVLLRLSSDNDLSHGFFGLSGPARAAVGCIVSYYSALGALVYYRMVDEAIIVGQVGFRANRAWQCLAVYVDYERAARGDLFFAKPYEHLVSLVQRGWPPDDRYGLKLGTVPRIPLQMTPRVDAEES